MKKIKIPTKDELRIQQLENEVVLQEAKLKEHNEALIEIANLIAEVAGNG